MGTSATEIEKAQRLAAAATELREQCGGWWGEHPTQIAQDWRYEVANGDTKLGYWEWVANQIEMESDAPEGQN